MQAQDGARGEVVRRAGDDENLYIVAYDIMATRRWRRVFRIMEGYGEWVQLSVFQCRLNRMRRIELKLALKEAINHREDHVVILDLGPAAAMRPRVESLGKPFAVVERGRLSCRILAAAARALLLCRNPEERSRPIFDIVENGLGCSTARRLSTNDEQPRRWAKALENLAPNYDRAHIPLARPPFPR